MSTNGDTKRLGRYVLSDFIGGGPTGRIHKAQIDGTGRVFALKEFHAHYCEDSAIAEQLAIAARQYGALEHPLVAPLHGFVAEGAIIAAVEYIEGISLDLLLQGNTLLMGAGAQLVVQLGRAVGYAHGRGLSHLGISPSNMMCTPTGELLVTDFGFLAPALMCAHSPKPALGRRIGYLSPEQLEGKRTSPASDVYSMGVVAYELLVGHMPYGILAGEDLKEAMISAPIAEPDLPKLYQQILKRALARSPFERFSDAAAMADALDAAMRAHPVPGSLGDIGNIVSQRLERGTTEEETTQLYDEEASAIVGAFNDMPTREMTGLSEANEILGESELLLGPAGAKQTRPEFGGISMALAPYGMEMGEQEESDLEGAHLVDVEDASGPSENRFGDTENEVPLIGQEYELEEGGDEPPVSVPYSTTVRERITTNTLLGVPPGDVRKKRKKPKTSIPPIPPIPPIVSAKPVLPASSNRHMRKTTPPPKLDRHTRKTTPPPPGTPVHQEARKTAPPPTPIKKVAPPAVAPSPFPVVAPSPSPSVPVTSPLVSPVPGVPAVSFVPELALSFPTAQLPMADSGNGQAAREQLFATPLGKTPTKPTSRKWVWGAILLPLLAAGGYMGMKTFVWDKENSDEISSQNDAGGIQTVEIPHSTVARFDAAAPKITNFDAAVVPTVVKPDAGLDAGDASVGDAQNEKNPLDAGLFDAALSPKVSESMLTIASTPKGASVYLDGTLVGETPIRLDASLDSHTLALIYPGYALHTAEIQGKGALLVSLLEVTPGGGPGGIKVRCRKKNRYYIFVDGNPTGQLCPSERIGVPKGQHVVEIYDPVTDSRKEFKAVVTGTRASLRVRVD